ncbi:MAG TPA: hypothetical protein VLL52_06120 [Anaerolineae bacterium]|nr:hypothetical protein [Anaerolineae bacterium]
MKRYLIILLTITLLLFQPSPPPLYACSCTTEPIPPAVAYADATDVFIGHVTKVTPPYPWSDSTLNKIRHFLGIPKESPTSYEMTLQVIKSWKGVDTSTVTVKYDVYDSCSSYLDDQTTYLVYAYNWGDDTLYTYHCSRTRLALYAASDLDYLNSLPTIPLQSTDSDYSHWGLLIFLFILLYFARLIHNWFNQKILHF